MKSGFTAFVHFLKHPAQMGNPSTKAVNSLTAALLPRWLVVKNVCDYVEVSCIKIPDLDIFEARGTKTVDLLSTKHSK